MKDRANAAKGRRFSGNGRAGRAPGLGNRNNVGTAPWRTSRPDMGWAMGKRQTRPPEPPKRP